MNGHFQQYFFGYLCTIHHFDAHCATQGSFRVSDGLANAGTTPMLIAKKTTLLEVAGSLLLLSLALLALCLLQSDTHSVRTYFLRLPASEKTHEKGDTNS